MTFRKLKHFAKCILLKMYKSMNNTFSEYPITLSTLDLFTVYFLQCVLMKKYHSQIRNTYWMSDEWRNQRRKRIFHSFKSGKMRIPFDKSSVRNFKHIEFKSWFIDVSSFFVTNWVTQIRSNGRCNIYADRWILQIIKLAMPLQPIYYYWGWFNIRN